MAPTRGALTFGPLPWWPLLLLLVSSALVVAEHHHHLLQHNFMSSSYPSSAEYRFGQLLDSYLQAGSNESCSEVWCESTDPGYFDEDEFDEDGTRGFWLEPPPDDILYMPPPPMPPSFHASLLSMENGSLKEFIIGEDPEEGYRCNFCKLFSDPLLVPAEDPMIDMLVPKVKSKSDESFVNSFYVLITSLAVLLFVVLIALMKYKKWKIFPMSDSCPILSGGSVLGHHKSSSGSSGSPSDTRLPVVNEKSPQSIIMDAPLASLGKKSTISTTGKYWKRMPAGTGGVNGNIFSMEDRRGHLHRSMGGSSMSGCMSEHPYSDAASCTSSPVYAELDPSVAGSCHTPTMIGPPGSHLGGGGGGSIISSSFSPYAASNTYSEVPENIRGHLVHLGNGHNNQYPHHPLHAHHQGMSPSPLLTDSSTYDNAAYLPASSQQPFLASNGGNHYATRSLRRLAAQRSAVLSAVNGNGTPNGGGNHQQVSTPLLAGHPYHVQPFAGTLHHHQQHHLQSTPLSSPGNQFQQFLTGGRPLKKPRPGAGNHHNQQQQQQTSFGSYHRNAGPVPNSAAMLNHYITSDADLMLATDDHTQLTSPPAAYGGIGSVYNGNGGGGGGGGPFSAYLDSSSNGSSNRKSSSSSQYTEMPLLANNSSSFNHSGAVGGMNSSSNGIGHYRMSATCSANDLNSAASSSSGGSGNGGGNHITNSTSSANSSTSLKRPLPPVPGLMMTTAAATNNTGHVRL